MTHSEHGSSIGRRIIVVGQSCSGKSTLGEHLATFVGGDFIELDALYWKPGWQPSPDDEFQGRLAIAAARDTWVASGQYHRHSSITLWPRADTVIWLDLPLHVILRRIVRRSWLRWRSGELLWGTNTEDFWRQLKVWKGNDSLIAYAIANRRVVRERYLGAMSDPNWANIRFIRLRSAAEIRSFLSQLG